MKEKNLTCIIVNEEVFGFRDFYLFDHIVHYRSSIMVLEIYTESSVLDKIIYSSFGIHFKPGEKHAIGFSIGFHASRKGIKPISHQNLVYSKILVKWWKSIIGAYHRVFIENITISRMRWFARVI